jgi:putative acyl-CoA dehydrogenase
VLPDGTRNVFAVQRLKDKLGNRSNASSEIELDGTVGYLVGEPGRGVRTIIEMVARTREDCVHGTAAGMRQGVAEALWHARHRTAFGARLVDQPAMTAVLADLALESEAATLTSLRLAAAFDAATARDDDGAQARAFSRLATAVAKYWVCKRGPAHAYEAMECLGGNGYTEAFPLARRYREQPVMAIWEGSGNVIALDVLRALARDPESFDAFDAEVSRATGTSAVLDRHLVRTRRLVAELARDPAAAPAQARRLVEALALALQASLMTRFASDASADAFVAARLGEDRGLGYGVLPSGTNLGAVLADHAGCPPSTDFLHRGVRDDAVPPMALWTTLCVRCTPRLTRSRGLSAARTGSRTVLRPAAATMLRRTATRRSIAPAAGRTVERRTVHHPSHAAGPAQGRQARGAAGRRRVRTGPGDRPREARPARA